MAVLNVLLGAGFSFNAGLPLVAKLSELISADYTDRIIRWSSGEWKWAAGKSDDVLQSGRLGGDHIVLSCMMNKVIQSYTQHYGNISNYEVFFDLVENAKESWFEEVRNLAVIHYRNSTNVPSDSVIDRLQTMNKWNVLEVLNYLIADALALSQPIADIQTFYGPFLKHLQAYDEVYIHTLNHDVLAEALLTTYGLSFSDGFTKSQSELISAETDDPIPTYQGKFDQKISILKLHGSIDLIQYRVGHEQGALVTPTGRLIYFKPESYADKHFPIRIDPATDEVLQQLPSEVVPKFITGLTKPRKIAIDYMYSDLFKRFRQNITKKGAEMLIIGYSYGDAHVNDIIQDAEITTRIRNVNPTWRYPFKKYKNATDFNYLDDEGVFK
jgi:hypothetical protein